MIYDDDDGVKDIWLYFRAFQVGKAITMKASVGLWRGGEN